MPIMVWGMIVFPGMQLSTCQHETLQLVSFLMHVLGKSLTRMPVIVWGMAVAGECSGFT